MNSKYISKDKLKQIPELPGIYKMLNSRGSIIYIGKSKCLRKRVQSYFVSTPKWDKVNRMVSLIKDIEYIVTDTHLEARLLECELIKEYKPPFNAQMKNDQGYFFIKIEKYNKNNPLSITDNRTEDSFGPFRSRYTINEFLGKLKNLYPITKSDGKYMFDYNMLPVHMDETAFNINRLILMELFSKENNIDLLNEALQTRLEEAAIAYRYEAASIYRDMISCFISIQKGLNGYKELLSRNILLKLPIINGYKLFYIANGIIINNKITDKLNKAQINIFIKESIIKLSEKPPITPDEKSWIDYRDIMFSEILNLPDKMVELL